MSRATLFGVIAAHLLFAAAALAAPLVLAPLAILSAAVWWWGLRRSQELAAFAVSVLTAAAGIALQGPYLPLLGTVVLLLPAGTRIPAGSPLPFVMAGAGFAVAAIGPLGRLDLPFAAVLALGAAALAALDRLARFLQKGGRHGHL